MKYSRKNTTSENKDECVTYHARTRQKQIILNELKQQGLRITNQRNLIIDIILSNECSCCKEIFYQANRKDPSIGIATVYRMLKTLEEIGIIDRKNLYRISCNKTMKPLDCIELEFNGEERIALSGEEVKSAVQLWLRTKGINEHKEISNIYQCV